MARNSSKIDVSFDFRTDTPEGEDPDAKSPTLREYHRLLWSRTLPLGAPFRPIAPKSGAYLRHSSAQGEFVLSSDTIIPTFEHSSRLKSIVARRPRRDRESFARLRYTIGGMMVFPANKIDGKMTINGARGCHPKIKDRFDLTLECIRRFYAGCQSPLYEVIARYERFFGLFQDFSGYVEFFFLQDLVESRARGVRFMLPFDGFASSPLPHDFRSYLMYCASAEDFLIRRNNRIAMFTAV